MITQSTGGSTQSIFDGGKGLQFLGAAWRFIDTMQDSAAKGQRDVIEGINLCAAAAAFVAEHRVGNAGTAVSHLRFTDRGLRHHFEVVGHIIMSSYSCRLESLTVRKRARCRPVTVPQRDVIWVDPDARNIRLCHEALRVAEWSIDRS